MLQDKNNLDDADAMHQDLIKRKVSQLTRPPSSPALSPFGSVLRLTKPFATIFF